MKLTQPPGGIWQLYRLGGIPPAIASMFDMRSAQQMAFIRSMLKEQRNKSLYEISLDRMEIVVFDLETTGFSPYGGDEIISLGAIALVGQEVQFDQTYYSIVNPKRIIPQHIVELTGISNEMTASAPDRLYVLKGFLDFVQQKILAAHGTTHDKRFLNAALWKTSKASLSHRVLDTMLLAKWIHPNLKDYSLDSLLDLYGIEVTNRHHALDDCLMTAKLLSKFLVEIQGRNVHTLGDLYAAISRYPSIANVGFCED